MNRVIITGATCMLGLALIGECVSHGVEVTALIRRGSKKRALIPDSSFVSVYECDLGELSSFSCPNPGGYDAFYHFGWGFTDKTGRYDVALQQQNIAFTLDAVRLSARLKCGKFIGAGSQAEYGLHDGPIAPDAPTRPDSAYGVAKYSAGRLASLLCKEFFMEFIWTRIFSVYGMHDMQSTMVMYCIDSLLKGEKPILTKCEQMWDYLFSGDAGRAFYMLGEKGRDQVVYNVGSGVSLPLWDYVVKLRDAIDPQMPLGIGEAPYSENQTMHLCADISRLTEDTGFRPFMSFESGISKTIEWYKKR